MWDLRNAPFRLDSLKQTHGTTSFTLFSKATRSIRGANYARIAKKSRGELFFSKHQLSTQFIELHAKTKFHINFLNPSGPVSRLRQTIEFPYNFNLDNEYL